MDIEQSTEILDRDIKKVSKILKQSIVDPKEIKRYTFFLTRETRRELSVVAKKMNATSSSEALTEIIHSLYNEFIEKELSKKNNQESLLRIISIRSIFLSSHLNDFLFNKLCKMLNNIYANMLNDQNTQKLNNK